MLAHNYIERAPLQVSVHQRSYGKQKRIAYLLQCAVIRSRHCVHVRFEAHAEKRAILPDPPPDAIHLIAVDLISVIFECGPGNRPDSPPDNYPYWPF